MVDIASTVPPPLTKKCCTNSKKNEIIFNMKSLVDNNDSSNIATSKTKVDNKSKLNTTRSDTNNNSNGVIVTFRRNYFLPKENIENVHNIRPSIMKVFPPILYTNVHYTNGIRLSVIASKDKKNNSSNGDSSDYIECIVPKDYYNIIGSITGSSIIGRPISFLLSPSINLTSIQSYFWSQPYMAEYIVANSKKKSSKRNVKKKKCAVHSETEQQHHTNHSDTSSRCINRDLHPNHTLRFLGTVTRTMSYDDEVKKLITLMWESKTKHQPTRIPNSHHHNKKPNPSSTTTSGITKKVVQSMIKTNQRRLDKQHLGSCPTSTDPLHHDVIISSNEIQNLQQLWIQHISSSPTVTTLPCWDVQHGNILPTTVGDDSEYISVSNLYHILQTVLRNNNNTSTTANHNENSDSYYVMSELISILSACQDLSNPNELWEIPLVMVYPVVQICTTSDIEHCSVTIQLAIYAHRLLMEIYTPNSVRIILRNLDIDSYYVTIPKCSTDYISSKLIVRDENDDRDYDNKNGSINDDPIFVSCPYPKVIFENTAQLEEELVKRNMSKNSSSTFEQPLHDDTIDGDDDDDRKMPATDTSRVISPSTITEASFELEQVDIERGDQNKVTRTVSAFTPTGLLKIFENDGCCRIIPNWYTYYYTNIEPIIANTMQLPLMLHQQYAIVWMYHMEHLPNFGINSLFWEEREFLDTTPPEDEIDMSSLSDTSHCCSTKNNHHYKYYVNTALGQIRFEPPETMKGGLLCDEMGLGM
jgi:SNF2-related domain